MYTQVAANQRLYTVTEDLTTSYRLLVHARVVDAIDGEPVRVPFTVAADRDDLSIRLAEDGFFAVGGAPGLVFSRLAAAPYSFELTVRAPGYRDRTLIVNLPAGATFPRPALVFSLRRRPVRLQGRVTRAAVPGAPVPSGASVAIGAGTALVLRTPLSFDHGGGTPVFAAALAPAGAAKTLDLAAAAGETTVTLSNRSGLAVGRILRFGAPERFEYVRIAGLAPVPADPAQPGEVTLRTPLRRSFAAGAGVRRIIAITAGSQPLAAAVAAGEGVLRLANPLAAVAVQVGLAADAAAEYHAVGALTDGDGFYRLDGLAGIAGATFVARAAGFNAQPQPWVIDYPTPVNVLDFRLETP